MPVEATLEHAPVTIDPVKFITAGKARFTLVSKNTGKRYTYKVSSSDKKWTPDSTHPTIYWVSLLVGSDNTSDYQYIGTIFPKTGMKTTPKSRMNMDSEPVKALKFVWDFLHIHNRLPATVEMWHEGRCARCGGVLTVPESIASGFGPECRGKVG